MESHYLSIKRLDLRKDLAPVAELIDSCFKETMDPDGRRFLNFLRSLAKDQRSLLGALNDPLRAYSPLDGFICKSMDTIVGNISITPFKKGQEKVCFVSNVAVNPDYRLRGVAGSLVREVEKYAKKAGFDSIWLQVRKENEVAKHLYKSLNYQEQASRTTWVINRLIKQESHFNPCLSMKPRRAMDWHLQETWMYQNYPNSVSWQLELKLDEFAPKIWQSLSNTISGRRYQHISFWSGSELNGILTWQSSYRFADPLWLAYPPEYLPLIINEAIPTMQNYLLSKKPLMVNVDSEIGEENFLKKGFEKLHTLIWMEKSL